MERLTDIVQANLGDENFGVSQLAEEAGKSRSHIHRYLKEHCGESVSHFICRLRLEKAMVLLQQNSSTVSEIAYDVGFRSPSYFIKCFHEKYGYSPGEVKKGNYEEHVKQAFQNTAKSSNLIRILAISGSAIVLVIILLLTFDPGFKKQEFAVAVLPIANLTGIEDNEYFAAGLHDALIGELGNISALRIISRTSTLRYANSNMFLKDIAEELNVNIIVEASLSNVVDSVRLMVQVIDVFPKEDHLLTAYYTDRMENILLLQSSVVKDIVEEINVQLTEKERLQIEQKRQVNPEVYLAYQRGMYYLYQGTGNYNKGLNYLLDAIDIDPADPFAYAALALGYAKIGHGQENTKESFNRALYAAKMAIKLDPTVDEAYTALAMLHLYHSWNWDEAKIAFEKAIDQNPNNETAHAQFAWYWVLTNEHEKAIYHAKKAAELNPFYISRTAWLALIYLNTERYGEAEESALEALKMNPKVAYANIVMGLLKTREGNFEEALEYIERVPATSYYNIWKTYVYCVVGKKDLAIEVWNRLNEKAKKKKVNPYHLGMIALNLGYTEQAYSLLTKAAEGRVNYIQYVNFNYCSRPWRQDPQFKELLGIMNLPLN